MDAEREKQALQEKLIRCRMLLSEFPEGVTAKNLNDLAAEIEQKISFVKEPEAITVAQPSLEPVSRSPLFIVVIGGFLAGVLASIVTLVWALFSHARKRMSAV